MMTAPAPPPFKVSPLMGAWLRVLRFGFRLLYNEMAWTYDAVSWGVSLGEWRSWQRAAIPHLNAPPDSLILEVAHGTANLQIDLRAAGYRSIGIDLSPYMGQIARRKLLREGIQPSLIRARAQALPFADASFHAVVSTFPTEFIIDPATLSEINRVLHPDGRLVFVPNGELTNRGAVEQGLELAYRVTGQRGGWPSQVTRRFSSVGFSLQVLEVQCKRSIAQVVIAQKQ
ncbi:MAG: methyltransferase domain-containing protein [Anaerolineae bacterium]